MSDAALRHYRRLASELLLARQLAGGELSQDEEADRADELHAYWQQMTEGERQSIEDDVTGHALELPSAADAPERLVPVDVLVAEHARTAPRR